MTKAGTLYAIGEKQTSKVCDPDIPDSNSTGAAVRLQNMANVSQI